MTPFIVKSLCHPFVHFVGTGDVDLVIPVLVGQTSFVTTVVWFLPICGDKLSCEAMVKQRNRPHNDEENIYLKRIRGPNCMLNH